MALSVTSEHHKAMGLVGEIFNRSLSPADYQVLCEASIIIAVSALRERQGDEFVRGFLDSALQSLSKPNPFSINPTKRH
ncbi:hypothetical protein Y819_001863 [Salmonella enterica subsp. enterica]|nr:hypothetical protein [Salmonella enterica]EDM9768673.1 hypothetical protein [Salmonella enterica subsp. enterica serovar Corvallis]EDP8614834.1 hypothetical protein [Salmonella enterica subsp. enterica]ECO4186694.1 hypothetical protein [Salmonella enterica]EKY7092079.1 hypothetical protein [Salmonella enterica]